MTALSSPPNTVGQEWVVKLIRFKKAAVIRNGKQQLFFVFKNRSFFYLYRSLAATNRLRLV